MITCLNINHRSVGRLGNKLFIIAAAYGAHKGEDFGIPTWKYQAYFPNVPVKDFSDTLTRTRWKEPHYHYRKIPTTYSTDILNLKGYFQSWKYFEGRDVLELFKPTAEVKAKVKAFVKPYGKTASIHVRRGDYLRFPKHHPVCPIEYYNKAMLEIKADTYIVCSDDIAWCKHRFTGSQFIFSEGNDEIFDLFIQVECNHNIIANSSFSWWGAYLNSNPDKIVVAPKRWFGPAYKKHNTKDLYPKGWKKL